ncbi:hypothetical protein PVAND_005727 [Polypedilum vanderplanki]|uniref:Uncharacterized protein n=1 Tax=Polypedilum vanderplanki TaxID=319348 RepID=A0A9J6C225_POLVA|nr:hypothetical protein PVAND_005727 [Polypedilum vanderplanki]
MSVCVSSALSTGMTTHASHMHMTPAMMNPFQNHQMAPLTIDMSTSSATQQQQQQQHQNVSSNVDPNEPNPEMLLALIARNKALEADCEEELKKIDFPAALSFILSFARAYGNKCIDAETERKSEICIFALR